MSNKMKKRYPSKYKAKNRSYQNFWHISKLTKKQQKWSKFKGKMHMTEQGRPVAKHRLLKTVRPSFTALSAIAEQQPSKAGSTKTTINRGMRYKVEYPFTKIFAPEKKRCVPAVSTMSSAQEKLDTSSAYQSSQKQFSKPVFLWNYKTNSGVFSKKANGLYYKPFWFFDKAAPIPGVSFLKKAKVLYSLKQFAYKKFQSMLAIQNKKQIVNLLNIVQKKNLSKNWNAILQMDSLYMSVQRKTAFSYNAQERKAAYHSHRYTINGKYYTNNIGVVKAADLFNTNTNNSFLGSKTTKVAQPSRQMVCVGLRSLRSVAPKTSAFQTVKKSLQKKNKKSSLRFNLYRQKKLQRSSK